MYLINRAILLVSLIAMSVSACAQKGSASARFSNAHQAARQWARIDTSAAINADDYKLLLGSLIWYADLQDAGGDVYGALFQKLQKYPQLDSIASIVFVNLYPVNTIFKAEFDSSSFNTITDKDARKFITSRYDTLLKAPPKQRSIDSTIAKLNTYDSLAESARSLDVEIGRLSANNAKSNEQSDTLIKDSSDIAAIKKLMAAISTDTLSQGQVAKIRTDLGKRTKAISDSVDAIKREVNKYILANADKLSAFLTAINKSIRMPVKAPRSLSMADAGQKFSEDRQDFTVSYLSELSAPQGAFHLPSQAEMIDAVAIYLAKRMKQEAVMWFFETISKNAKSFELITTFFPNTIKMLGSYEVYEIPNMGAQWQYALSKDFVQMPANVLGSEWLKKRCPAMAPYRSFISGGTAMAALLQDRYSFREIISRLYLDGKLQPDKQDGILGFDKVVSLLYAVNTELFVPDSAQHYRMLKYEDYRGMTAHELEIMISLLDMKYNGIFSGLLKGMDKSLQLNAKVKAEDIRILLGKVEQTVSRIEIMRTEYSKEMQKSKEKNWDYTTYNVWTSASELWNIFDAQWAENDIFSERLKNSRRAFNYMGELYEVYNLVSKKNYAGAVNNTLKLIDSIFYGASKHGDNKFSFAVDTLTVYRLFGKNELLREVIPLVSHKGKLSAADSDRLATLKARYDFETDTLDNDTAVSIRFEKTSPMAAIVFEKDRHAIQQIRKLAAFLNDAALAQSDRQLAKAIESYALPPGSYKRKRNNWYSLDLNAYTGIYGGTEGLFQKKYLPEDYAGVIGFSAPIGLTLSKTFSNRKVDEITTDYILNPNKLKLGRRGIRYRSKLNIAVTLSIVDLGAVVSYRLSNTTAQALPTDVKWDQFLSPGLHFAVGIPATPLVGMIGAQFTPKLREIAESSQQYNAFRIYGGLYFDLPLINLWERKRIAY